jgi:hypothetical protein
MKVTKHAAKRINFGDRAGHRTLLSIEEVAARILADDAIKVSRETFFWSEIDDSCLMAITAQKQGTLITVYPPDRDMAPWMAFLSKYRFYRKPVFEQVETTSFDPRQAIQVSLVVHEVNGEFRDARTVYEPFCVWYSFPRCDSPMFKSKDFHEMLVAGISEYLNEHQPSKKRTGRLFVEIHGYYWACLCPAYVPFEVLGLPNPFT